MTARSRHTFTPTSWQADAACIDWPEPEDFFPDRGEEHPAVLALCATCPVGGQCRAEALRDRQRYGIWGGLTERDRERVWEEQARRRRGDQQLRSAS